MRVLSSLCLLAMTLPVAAEQIQPVVVGNRVTLESKVLGEQRAILVRTPPGYEANGQRYPVLYITDGDAHFLHTVGAVEFLARNGRIPEMIVVGIGNTDRTRDLTPTRSKLADGRGELVDMPTSGGADNFLRFIEIELIPWIEARFRTQPFRILGGHSFGGLFSVHVMLASPDVFDAYIAVSPSLHWDDRLMVRRARELFKKRRAFRKFFYMTLGNEGARMQEPFEAFRRTLPRSDPENFHWDWKLMPDEDHGTVVLRSHYFALRHVFDGWAVPQDPANGAFVGGLQGLKDHFSGLSKRYGFTIPIPENMANLLGYQHLGREEFERALEVFRFNVESYPESANVYDSLGEAYERSGRLELARENYERAVTLGERNADRALDVYRRNLGRVVDLLRQADSG